MLTLLLSLTLVAPPARGIPGAHSPEMVTQVDERLAAWVKGEGLASVHATAADFKSYISSMGVAPADVPAMVEAALKDQAEKPTPQPFAPVRALAEYVGKLVKLHLFDEGGHLCEVSLLAIAADPKQRYVLLEGPRFKTETFDDDVKAMKDRKEMVVFLEKQKGVWNTASLPTPAAPDCTSTLKAALKAIFTAEKAYFAEHDAYTNSLSKAGVDLRPLKVSTAKVSVAGAAPQQTFTIQVGIGAAVMTMNHTGEVTVIAPCDGP